MLMLFSKSEISVGSAREQQGTVIKAWAPELECPGSSLSSAWGNLFTSLFLFPHNDRGASINDVLSTGISIQQSPQ